MVAERPERYIDRNRAHLYPKSQAHQRIIRRVPTASHTAPTRQHRQRMARAKVAERYLSALPAEQVDLIRGAWELSRAAPGDFAAELYANLFALAPAAASLFPGDLTQQRQRLTHTLSESLALLERPQELLLLLKASGVRHVHYGAGYGHFVQLGKAIDQTFQNRLGGHFTPAHRQAWRAFYDAMAQVLCGAMAGAQFERA